MSDLGETNSQGKNKKKLFIVWIVLLTSWITMTLVPVIFAGKTGRLFADNYDRMGYFEIGKWLPENTLPKSEYPQIPTLLFGVNHLASIGLDANMQPGVNVTVFSLEMLLILFLVFKILIELLPAAFSNYAFLILLPPTVYFAFNRYDILPAFMCLAATVAAKKRQWVWVSIILAFGTFTKWYPVLLLPGFLGYATQLEKKFQWKMIIAFTITSVIILLPSYMSGGLESLLAPYQFHTARGMEFIAFPLLINNTVHALFNIDLASPFFFLCFFVLQIAAPLLIFWVKIDSVERLTDYCIIAIGGFVLFSRIWSPQWFLWVLPFLILAAKNKKAVWIIIIYNLLTYLAFPIFFDTYGHSSVPLQIAGLGSYILLIIIIYRSVRGLQFSKIYNPLK